MTLVSSFKSAGLHSDPMADLDWGWIREDLKRFLAERLHLFFSARDLSWRNLCNTSLR